MLRKAHVADTDITSMAFSKDNLTLLSRAADDTLKVLASQQEYSTLNTDLTPISSLRSECLHRMCQATMKYP